MTRKEKGEWLRAIAFGMAPFASGLFIGALITIVAVVRPLQWPYLLLAWVGGNLFYLLACLFGHWLLELSWRVEGQG
jgi:NhaP-type Na+/H+ and K+/H+ antiporter